MANPISVPGSVVPSGSLISPGGAQGVQGLPGPTVVSADAGNIATIGSDNLILVPQSQIWSVRLRSFNALSAGNPTFEVTQRNCGTALSNPAHGTMLEDRWATWNNGALNPSFQVLGSTTGFNVPGTNFCITRRWLRITSQTQKVTLGANDILGCSQLIEGPLFRELINDVHSVSLLCQSSVANLKFGLSITDTPTTKSLTKLCTLGAANTITLIPLPNLPIYPSGNFSMLPGVAGYLLNIGLAVGSTYTSPANDTFQNGNFVGATGQGNFLANTAGSTFDLFFVQHEPGPLCTTPIDCPFSQNLTACQRYYTKSYSYAEKPGIVQTNGAIYGVALANSWPQFYTPFKVLMAKTPAIVGYSPNTGTINAVRDQTAAVDRGINSAIYVNENGFGGFNVTTTNAAIAEYGYHYTADTGW